MIVLGLDPGKDGALVVLDGRAVVSQIRTSTLIGTAKWQAAHANAADVIRSMHAEYRLDLAVLELYAARPGQSTQAGLTCGVGWGLWLGILSGLKIPVRTPASQAWTKDLFKGIAGEGKERSVSLCRQEIPDLDLTPGKVRKPHDGLADAGCLALWGQRFGGAR